MGHFSISSRSFIVVNLVVGGLAVTSEYQTCYKIDGTVLSDIFRCDNSTIGHSSCCNAGNVCWLNGVCQGVTQGVDDYLREGCTDHMWNDPACFDVCPWNIENPGTGVRPCGGIDQSNLYCCDNGTTGIGSFACCSDESSRFNYENITTLPTVIATIPLGDESSSSSSSIAGPTTTTLVQFTTVAPSPTLVPSTTTDSSLVESASSSDTSDTSVGLGAGLGVGLPVAAAIIGGIWWVIWRSRRKQLALEKGERHTVLSDSSTFSGGPPRYSSPAYRQEAYGRSQHPELAAGFEHIELPAMPLRGSPSSGEGTYEI